MQTEAAAKDAIAPELEETGPLRRCALTREPRPKEELIRFVLGPEGEIVPDLRERLPGRGVWVTAAHDLVTEAARRNVFARALKTSVKVPEKLAERVDRLLGEDAQGALSFANKAGQVVFGFGKVEEAIHAGKVVALLHAFEASADGTRKLDGKMAAKLDGERAPAVRIFTSDELGLASGRANVIHAAVLHGGAAAKLLKAASRVERYRKGSAAF